uniref:MRG domain-containing protein n=1 Tax=Panagrolaimus superbus TaxID=310955 RepID=A0A914XZH7_9BILA
MANFIQNLKQKQTIFCLAKADAKWYKSKIQKIVNNKNGNGKCFQIHYFGWSCKFDEWYTGNECEERFKEFSLENAYEIQEEAVETVDLPLQIYSMKSLGFPTHPPCEMFSDFLKDHPEALKSRVLKSPLPRNSPPIEQLSSSSELNDERNAPMEEEEDKQPTAPPPPPPLPTVAEVINDALIGIIPFLAFIDKDIENCEQQCFARLPARFTVVDILNHYLKSFYDDKVANRHILAKNAFEMFNFFALSKLILPQEAPYVLAVLNHAREGKVRRKFPFLSCDIPLAMDIFGYNYLCRLVKFAFVYYKNFRKLKIMKNFNNL